MNDFHDSVSIPMGSVVLDGDLFVPSQAKGIVIFSHGSGSSRFSQRNRMVAEYLQGLNFGTLLFDLLTREEDRNYNTRFNIDLLTRRLVGVTEWLESFQATQELTPAYFGASTGAASALRAAALLPQIGAVVSRGGRPDLAMHELYHVQAPTLLIVGSLDYDVIKLNNMAYAELNCEKKLEIVNGASHLFEEPGTMEEVCRLAGNWFGRHLDYSPAYHEGQPERR